MRAGRTAAYTPGIWNPLPYFDTVRADKQVGNIQGVSSFSGTISNAGTIAAAHTGIAIASSTITGRIVDSGNLYGGTGPCAWHRDNVFDDLAEALDAVWRRGRPQ